MNGFDEGVLKMKAFKKILYPVIFSKSSDAIVPFVHTVAKQFNSQIHLLFVVKVFEHLTISQPDKEILAEAKRRLLEFKNDHFSAFPDTVTSVVVGDTQEKFLSDLDLLFDKQALDLIASKGLGQQTFGGRQCLLWG